MRWVIVGAGAQGRITLDILRCAHANDQFHFVDDDQGRIGQCVQGVAVIARSALPAVLAGGDLRAIVAIGNNEVRLRIAAELADAGCTFGNVVHPSVVVLPSAELAVGILLCPGAIVGSGAVIEAHALINTAVVVEHDCRIGAGASLSPGVRMAGRVSIGRAAFIGSGATINPRIRIGEGAIVGSGALVTRDVPPGMLAYGVPARVVRPVDPIEDWKKLL